MGGHRVRAGRKGLCLILEAGGGKRERVHVLDGIQEPRVPSLKTWRHETRGDEAMGGEDKWLCPSAAKGPMSRTPAADLGSPTGAIHYDRILSVIKEQEEGGRGGGPLSFLWEELDCQHKWEEGIKQGCLQIVDMVKARGRTKGTQFRDLPQGNPETLGQIT